MNLMNSIICLAFLVCYHNSKQSWPWKAFCCVDIIAHGPLPLWGTLPPWLNWEFSWVLFSTATVLHLCYLSHLVLSSVLQVEIVEGLLDWICWKCFWMLQYDAVVYLSFSCYLSSQLSRPEEAEKLGMLLLMIHYLHLFDRLWSSSSGSPAHSTGARTAGARTVWG